MTRIVAAILILVGANLPAANAQVASNDNALLEQLLPESFKLEASAVVTNSLYRTSVSYALTNKSGMNLWMGVMAGSVAIGTCADARVGRGGLALLLGSQPLEYADEASAGPPKAVFVPAGGRVAGMIVVEQCEAPNPGSPTAQFSMSLLLSKTNAVKSMVQFPVSAEAPVRRAPAQ